MNISRDVLTCWMFSLEHTACTILQKKMSGDVRLDSWTEGQASTQYFISLTENLYETHLGLTEQAAAAHSIDQH